MSALFRFVATVVCFSSLATAQQPLHFLHRGDTLLFQGDSITDGGRQRTGSDYNHIMGQDYAYVLAAEIGSRYPEENITFVNRGISGDRVMDLAARWQTDTLDLKPQLLSILVGVNDTLAVGAKSETLEQYETIYDKLLADTIAALPETKIVLGEPFLLPVGRQKANFAAEMVEVKKRQAVVAKAGGEVSLAGGSLSGGVRRCLREGSGRALELGWGSSYVCGAWADGAGVAADGGCFLGWGCCEVSFCKCNGAVGREGFRVEKRVSPLRYSR